MVRPRRYSAAIAALVAGSALLALLLYRYHDLGSLGPIRSMYEPIWSTKKTNSAIAEGAALLAAILLPIVPRRRSAPTAADAHHRADNPRA
jgi:hypothetical protein